MYKEYNQHKQFACIKDGYKMRSKSNKLWKTLSIEYNLYKESFFKTLI